MNTKTFSEALGEIDGKYIESAISYQAERSYFSPTRRWLLPLAAAIMTLLLVGTAAAAAIMLRDLWIQKPSVDPVEVVRSALENQAGKEYTLNIEVNSVEIDEAETAQVRERFIKGIIADRRGWSDEYLAGHFLVVRADYYAEYDHTQTTRADGEVTMYFYLTQDADSGDWTIVDNSGNVNWSEDDSPAAGAPAAQTVEEQLFAYLSDLYNRAYSPYYDGLRYQIDDYEETTDGDTVTATFLWTMYYLGKGWDVGADEGVEQQVSQSLQAKAVVDENGAIVPETISVLADERAVGDPVYSTSIEETFPDQLGD